MADSIVVTGPAGGSDWEAKYYDALSGGQDITAAVTGGGWTVGPLASTASAEIRVELTLAAGVAGDEVRRAMIVAASQADNTVQDAVAVEAKKAIAAQPDLEIKNGADSAYVGDDIYNSDGEGQSRAQVVTPSNPAVYNVRLTNDGNAGSQFLILPPTGGAGLRRRWWLRCCGTFATTGSRAHSWRLARR